MKRAIKIAGVVVSVIVVGLVAVVIEAHFAIDRKEVMPAETGAPGRFVSVEGRRWHVATAGDYRADASGAPILMIHGFSPLGHLMWGSWPDELAGRRALIMPDILGYGFSDRNTEPGAYYTLESYAATLAAILDQLGVAQVDVIGHSYGGAIAARFAIDHPERVRSIVFMDAALFYEASAAERIIHLPLGIGRAVAWHMVSGGPGSFMTRFCKMQAGEFCLRPLQTRDTTDTLRAAMYTYRHSSGPDDLLRDLRRLNSRSLVIWGANDPIFPASQGQRLAREIKGELILIEDGYHLPYVRRPEEVTQHVLDFLQPRGE